MPVLVSVDETMPRLIRPNTMKRFALGLIGLVSIAQAQQEPSKIIKIKVLHADPYMIVSLIDGITLLSPELSTLMIGMGVPAQATQAMNKMFKGKFVVNPTDNSILFFPDTGN